MLQRRLRPGLFHRRELALEIARRYPQPRVLDVGGGSGRVGELLLEQGARGYVNVDLSEAMLEFAGSRLARFDAVELVCDDFLKARIDGQFDVVLALGYFDYVDDADAHLRRIAGLLAPGGSVVASFPRWTWTRGPLRLVRYRLIGNCPIFDYREDGLRRSFLEASLPEPRIIRGKSGFLVHAP